METNEEKNQADEGQQATHSGWQLYYSAFARYRDQAMQLGRLINGGTLDEASRALDSYHAALYTMAQQVFSFYDEELETRLTKEWFQIGTEVKDYTSLYSDPIMRNQMAWELSLEIPIELKTKLIKYFNKIDRLAADAGLLVNKEDKSAKEPKKGLVGFK